MRHRILVPIVSPTFIIEDELHAEQRDGVFGDRGAALAELRRLAELPWDGEVHRAPCTSWRTCGREYWLVEYDDSFDPWRIVASDLVLMVSAEGVKWCLETGPDPA